MPISTTPRSFAARVVIAALAAAVSLGAATERVAPLPNAHAHNDYLHARPLLDALEHGFTSVEADIFPVAGKLLVGHEEKQLKPQQTLESLYLAPLANRVQQNNGHVYPQASRFFLLIDFKDDPQQTYRLLQPLLEKYRSMLSVVENGKLRESAVTIVLTGKRPQLHLNDSRPRYAGLDGQLSELDSPAPAHFMPMISDDWSKHFQWDGAGPMPEQERAKLQEIVKKAHAAGRVVRFWKTPETETVWRELRAAGVDLINTDDLARLVAFLITPDPTPKQP